MKEFLYVLKRFAKPYSGNLFGSVFLNVFSAVFNIFSFALIIPLLRILFKMDTASYEYIPFNEFNMSNFFNNALNNLNWFFTDMMTRHSGSVVLLMIGAFLAVMTAAKCACYFGASAVMIPLRTGIVRDLRTMVYNKLMALPLGFFSDERKGDIVARMSGDVNEIEHSIGSVLDMIIKNPILIIFYFGTLIAVNWKLTLFTLTVVPLIAWGMGALGKTLKRKSLSAQNKWSDTMSQLDESLGGLRVIKAFNAEEKMKDRFLGTCNEYRRIFGRVATRQASAHPVSEFLGTLMIMLVLWFGGTLILSGSDMIDAPTFIFYMTILYSVLQPIKDLSKATYSIPKGLASMERIDKILLADNPIKEPANPRELKSFNTSIKFENVSFSYNGMKDVLSDICLEIPKGRTVAIVGQSGSGKSTLVDLIPRFYDVREGSITIDGKDVRDVAVGDLRELMGNVNQEAILFNDTIFNNIAFGVEGATKEDVIAAAKIANAHDFIMEKEDCYDTMIGDRGGKLSGGQRQRISIARAVLKNPPILILDEATSALDTESERLVQEALDRLTSSRTTIAIAHRLSTIKNADEILVMNEGRIVERGRHDELIALDGYYKRLNDMQAL